MPPGKYFHEFEEGETYTSPWRTISESHFWRFADITRLNEPLFEDREFVTEEAGLEDWLVPGWLTSSCSIGLFLRSNWFHGTVLAILEVKSMSWDEPVIVGDEIRTNVEVVDTTETSSDRGGVVELSWLTENRDGDAVMQMNSTHFIKKE